MKHFEINLICAKLILPNSCMSKTIIEEKANHLLT